MPDIEMNQASHHTVPLPLPAGGVKITEAFKELLSKKEFSAITISDIANNAGVNAALIYKYFGDKRGLLHYFLSDLMDGYFKNFEKDVKGIKGALNKLRKLIWSSIDAYETNRVFARVLLLEVRNHKSYFESDSYRKTLLYSSLLKETIEEGVREGDIRDDIPVMSILQALFGAMDYLCLNKIIKGKSFCPEDLTDDLCNIIFSGIEKQK
jgi:AcrR family transcriptional regulator